MKYDPAMSNSDYASYMREKRGGPRGKLIVQRMTEELKVAEGFQLNIIGRSKGVGRRVEETDEGYREHIAEVIAATIEVTDIKWTPA